MQWEVCTVFQDEFQYVSVMFLVEALGMHAEQQRAFSSSAVICVILIVDV
jgi:hypothetical protein